MTRRSASTKGTGAARSAASAYWERFEEREAMYYDDMVDAARDAPIE